MQWGPVIGRAMIAGVDHARSVRFAPLLAALTFALLAAAPLAEAGYTLLSVTVALPAVLLGAVIAVGASGRIGRAAVALWCTSVTLELVVHLAELERLLGVEPTA